jgi:hypothetical protein
MLDALLHKKIDRWLGDKDPESIEDLLTSVVLGTARYLPGEVALLPFLRAASSLEGEPLGPKLDGMHVKEVKLWPSLGTGSIPDAVVEFTDGMGRSYLLVIEAKLGTGKSSLPSATGPVTDQLGKYWLSLHNTAKPESKTALGVVYLTASATMPRQELEETQQELSQKNQPKAPLYWLSWRKFGVVVRTDGCPMLADCVKLLQVRWRLNYVCMQPLQAPPPLVRSWHFGSPWRWTKPPAVVGAWHFQQGIEHV